MPTPPEVRDSFAGGAAARAKQPFDHDASDAWKKGYMSSLHWSAQRYESAVAAGLTPAGRDHLWGKVAAEMGEAFQPDASPAWRAGYANVARTRDDLHAQVRAAEEAAAAAAQAERQRTGRDSSGVPMDAGVAGRAAYYRAIKAGLSQEEADAAAYETLWPKLP